MLDEDQYYVKTKINIMLDWDQYYVTVRLDQYYVRQGSILC